MFLPIEHDIVAWHRAQYKTIKHLKTRNDIYITKPDNGAGIVILNKRDDVNKMNVILGDSSKFRLISQSSTNDRTERPEVTLQKRLLGVHKSNFICKDTYNRTRPTGSQRPRLLGYSMNCLNG